MRKLFIIIGTIFVVSCNSNEVYNIYKPIENHQWHSNNKIEFIVNNIDTISLKNVFINIRNNKNYEFSSLYLITNIELPDGIKVVDTLEYEMTDASGKWLGSGFSDIKENKLFLQRKRSF